MSLMAISSKIVICSSFVCGLIGTPLIYTSSPKQKSKVALKLGVSGKGERGLLLENMSKVNQLLNGEKNILSVDDVGMKFGNQKLSSKDILIKPCENENKYYLLKFFGDLWSYKLSSGVKVMNLECHQKNLYDKLDYVVLNWAKPTAGRTNTLPIINLSDCSFNKGRNSSLQIICNKGQWARELRGTFMESDYEYK